MPESLGAGHKLSPSLHQLAVGTADLARYPAQGDAYLHTGFEAGSIGSDRADRCSRYTNAGRRVWRSRLDGATALSHEDKHNAGTFSDRHRIRDLRLDPRSPEPGKPRTTCSQRLPGG